MYLEHFGFDRLPFESLSNGMVYVDLPEHREAMNTVLFGLRSGEGFVKVVGEVGTGKTALCRSLLGSLDEHFVSVYVPDPTISPRDLMRTIADDLGVSLPPHYGLQLLQKYTREVLLDVARRGDRTAIFVDEAQTMPHASLEALRLLSNLETSQGRLVQVVLFGQPELDAKLGEYSLRQLQQRIAFSARLEPLDRHATRHYIARRLIHCGASAHSLFTPAATDRIYRASGGIPRLINMLCHKSLMAAFADGEFQISRRHVGRAIEDTEGIRSWKKRPLFGRTRMRRIARSADSEAERLEPSWSREG